MDFLRNLLAGPLELISSPFRFFEDMWHESDKSRALLLGLPAILVGLLGMAALGFAQYGMGGLEAGYVSTMEQVSKERQQLEAEIQQEGKLNKVAVGSSDEDADPRLAELEVLRDEESIYLKKLISMNPTEQDYRFRLAMSKLRTNPGHGVSILQDLAPESEAGYSKAHAFLANYYSSVRPKTQMEARSNRQLALKHAEYGLQRDKNDNTAKMIKAKLLMGEKQLVKAYGLFEELFEVEPGFYRPLVAINKELKRGDRNKSILNRALLKFNEKLSKQDIGAENWVAMWQQMIGCYSELNRFKDGRDLLQQEIDRMQSELSQLTDGSAEDDVEAVSTLSSRRTFLRNLLAKVYLAWAGKTVKPADGPASDAAKLEGLELAKNAYLLRPNDPSAMHLLTRLAIDENEEIAAAAKQVYDPFKHYAAPSSVLNELGANAMGNGDFDQAVRFFELARKKDPKNAMILNNLAYGWLKCGNRDPERALQLVDEGLRFISSRPDLNRYRSNFLDTRGNALVYLGRYEEAIASFQKALSTRPNDVNLLRQLVTCYEKADLDPSLFVRRIQRLEELGDGGGG